MLGHATDIILYISVKFVALYDPVSVKWNTKEKNKW